MLRYKILLLLPVKDLITSSTGLWQFVFFGFSAVDYAHQDTLNMTTGSGKLVWALFADIQ